MTTLTVNIKDISQIAIIKKILKAFDVEVIEQNNEIILNGNFAFNLTDFSMEAPQMFFLTVRNRIDISYNISFKQN